MPVPDKRNNAKSNNVLSKIAFLLSLVAGVVLVALLIALCMTDNVEVSQSRSDSGFVIVENAACQEVEAADTPIGVKKVYIFTLNEKPDSDTHLAFYTVHQYVDVYLDGQNIYSLKPSEKNQMIKTVGSNWVMIPLYRRDAGREI
ncbi:MAG: hypothetical protein ACI4SE_07440 [Lachnospiraceae bacterium]